MPSPRHLFYSDEEIAAQEAFESELNQMESREWAEYQRNLNAALEEFLIDRNMNKFQEKHRLADVEYGRRRKEWWLSKRPAKTCGAE